MPALDGEILEQAGAVTATLIGPEPAVRGRDPPSDRTDLVGQRRMQRPSLLPRRSATDLPHAYAPSARTASATPTRYRKAPRSLRPRSGHPQRLTMVQGVGPVATRSCRSCLSPSTNRNGTLPFEVNDQSMAVRLTAWQCSPESQSRRSRSSRFGTTFLTVGSWGPRWLPRPPPSAPRPPCAPGRAPPLNEVKYAYTDVPP